MQHARTLLIILALLTAPFCSALAQDARSYFTETQVAELADKIKREADLSANYRKWNQGYDIGFKVGALILSALAAIGAARISAMGEKAPPPWLRTSNLALTSVTALITAFGLTQFDFAKRHGNWERRFNALETCETTLRFSRPDRDTFLEQLDAIRKWGDYTNLSEMTASCTVALKTAKATKPGEKPEVAEKPTPAASK